MDLACGTGRNAMFLAGLGFAVDAVDISREALAIGRARAAELPIRWLERDLDRGFEPEYSYDVVVNIRFVNLPLLASLAAALCPNGVLVVEQHLAMPDVDVIGPKNPAFRVAPGELARTAAPLTVERLHEAVFQDPDGREVALARLFARNASQPCSY